MQIDCHMHASGQSLQCLLYDCFSNTHATHNITITNGYLIKSEGNKQADIYSFDNHFTQYQHITKIKQFSRISCLRFHRFKDHTLLIYALEQLICIKTIGCKTNSEANFILNTNLSNTEEFLYFSDIVQMSQYELFIAYTSLNQFYLAIIKNHNKLQFFKIIDKQYSFSFLSWFNKSSLKVQCTNIYLHLYKIDDRDHFLLLLSVKDKIVSLFLLQIYPQRSDNKMNLIGTCQSLKRVIPNSAIMKQVLIVSKDPYSKSLECIISYQLKEGFMLLLFVCVNFRKDNMFDVSVIAEDLPSTSFAMAFHHSHLLYTLYCNEEKVYKIFKKKVSGAQQKKHSQSRQTQILLILKDKPYYVYTDQSLFVTTSSQCYSIQVQNVASSQSSELSQLQQQIAQFKNQINHTYRKQVNRQLRKTPVGMEQILYLLTQKSRKIIEWINNEFTQLTSGEEHTYLILTLQIIITISIRILLSSTTFEELVRIESIKQQKSTIKELYQIISNCQISSVINLLNHIAEENAQIIQQILNKINQEKQLKYGCGQAIKTVYAQAYERIIAQIQDKQTFPKQYKGIVSTIISFDVGNSKIYSKILSRDQILFKNTIFAAQSINIFVQYFQNLRLEVEEIKLFAKNIYESKRQNLKRFIGQVITKCKRSMKENGFNYKQANLILQGFMEYPNQLVFQIKKHFPALLLFYYLKTGNRKQGLNYIKQLAKSTSSTNCSEVLQLAIADIEQQRFILVDQPQNRLNTILSLGSQDSSESQNSERKKKIKKS